MPPSSAKNLQSTITKKICFVCLGNICRSPLAEGIAKHLYAKMPKQSKSKIEFCSAGTSGFHNDEGIDSRSIGIARENGIDISHYTSKQVSLYGHSDVDLFVAMDKQNYATLLRLGFEPSKVVLLGDFGLGGEEVPDPYYGGSDGFAKVYEMLEAGIANLLERLTLENLVKANLPNQ